MDVLPSFIQVLSANGKPKGKLERVPPGERTEKEWDKIISENVELLADALRQAEMIADDSELMWLGCQIDNIDLVFAEVSPERELRRLVLLEDKLLKNPEARRHVLAQLLDYSRIVHEVWPQETTKSLERKLGRHDGWVESFADDIRQQCRARDFLLVIAGDGISDGLARLVRRFAGRDDPLNLSELALVSMTMYKSGTELLLVPHVVSAVQRSEREITVRVEVVDSEGNRVEANVSRDVEAEATQASRGRLPVREEVTDFLLKARQVVDGTMLRLYPGIIGTKKPRKTLDYCYELQPNGQARFKIHFGGLEKQVWSPILVGLSVDLLTDAASRDTWEERIAPLLPQLPKGTDITHGGPRTLNVTTPFPWSDPDELNDTLVAKVSETLLQFAEVLAPVMRAKKGR